MTFKGIALALLAMVFFAPSSQAFEARFALSPDNSREVLLSTIGSAKSQLLINIYQFSDDEILGAIQDRIRNGVDVSLLIEGEPYRGMSADGRQTIATLRKSMRLSKGDHRLFLMRSRQSDGTRRYRYNHAKYVLVDGHTALVASENFTSTGHAVAGTRGNRGWEVVLYDKDFTAKLEALFREDTDQRFSDVTDLVRGGSLPEVNLKWEALASLELFNKRRPNPAIAAKMGEVSRASVLTSPDAMPELAKLIRGARESLDVQHMSLPLGWIGTPGGKSPWVAEIVKAAKRGVATRVLLNDERAFNPNEPDETANEATVNFLRQVARCERLPIQARIINIDEVGITYVHNKGMLVDSRRALVSSINGTENSVRNNREVAVLLESEDATSYYGEAFDYDWRKSRAQIPAFEPSACEGLSRMFTISALLTGPSW